MKEKLKKLENFVFTLPSKVSELCHEIKDQLFLMLEKSKDLVKTNYELGLFHINNANMYDAKLRFMLVVKLKPDFAEAHYHLARCYIFELELNKAKKELEIALRLDPSLEVAKYRLKLIDKEVADVPALVIREDYNCLSKKYEDYMLQDQQYNAPELLVSSIKEILEKEKLVDISHNILDLGCGSGFVGAELVHQDIQIKTLVGLDISSKMLELAKSLVINDHRVYNSVKELDFHDLSSIPKVFDVITACLSLIYDNDITHMISKIETIASDKAILGLVVLKAAQQDVEFNYDQSCFAFKEEFLMSILNQYNWQILDKKEIKLFANGTMGLMLICKK